MRRAIVAAQVVSQLAELGMQHRTVQALVVILDDQLPVGSYVIRAALVKAQLLHAPVGKFLRQVVELACERRGMRIESYEKMPVPDIGAHGVQRIILARQVLHVRRADEFAIEPVSPAVVRTLNASRKFSLGGGADARAPVTAHIVESADRAAVVAIDDDAFVSDFPQKEVAWIRNLIGASGADPALAEKTFQFLRKDCWVGVVAGRKCLTDAVDVRCHPKSSPDGGATVYDTAEGARLFAPTCGGDGTTCPLASGTHNSHLTSHPSAGV